MKFMFNWDVVKIGFLQKDKSNTSVISTDQAA